MKIFLDTADVDMIRPVYETGLLNGVTTNPTLIKRSGRDPIEVIKEIQSSFSQLESISAEVVADTAEDLVAIIKYNQKNPAKGAKEWYYAVDFAESYIMPMRPDILIRHLNKVLL